jgi:cell division septum initiation protein DivIVA
MTALEELKKALEGVGPLKVEFTPDCDEFNAIIAPINDDYDGTFFTVIGCGDKQDKLGGFMAAAVNAVPALLSTLESLQRENENLRQRLNIGPCGEDAIDVAESAADHLLHRAEAAEAEVNRLRGALEGISNPKIVQSFGDPGVLRDAAPPAPSVAVKATEAKHHAVELRQCAIFAADVGPNIAKAMTDAADFLDALSAQVQDESDIVDCLSAGKPFVFDPATNFCHADDGGAPEHGIKYVPAAQVQDVAETEAIAALKEAEPYVEICHSLMTQKETRANVWRVLKQVRAVIAAAPAKQEGGHD